MRNVPVAISTLEDMVKLHNENTAIIHNNLKWLKRANSKTKLIAILTVGGTAYALKAVNKLATKVDRLEENYRSLYRNYIRNTVDESIRKHGSDEFDDDLG